MVFVVVYLYNYFNQYKYGQTLGLTLVLNDTYI